MSRMQGMLAALGAGVLLGLAGPSGAQEYVQAQPRPEVNLMLEGGLASYTGALGQDTSVGPSWGVLMNVQPFEMLGLELGYHGSYNAVNANTYGAGASLTRNGGSGLIKVSPPYMDAVKPFVGAGLGASYVSVNNSNAYRSNVVGELPLAAGLEFNTPSLTAGVRATYWLLTDSQLSSAKSSSGGLFGASATLGGRF